LKVYPVFFFLSVDCLPIFTITQTLWCAFCCPQGRFYSVLALFTVTVGDSNLNKHLMFAFWPHLNTDKGPGIRFHSQRKSLVQKSMKCYNNICPMKLGGQEEPPPREQSMSWFDCGNLQIAKIF